MSDIAKELAERLWERFSETWPEDLEPVIREALDPLTEELAESKAEGWRLAAELAEAIVEIKKLQVWRDVITDRLVCDWTLNSENVDDPVNAVTQMVATYISNAADPAISEQAAELARLRALLADYGRHMEGCNGPFGYKCGCGWAQEKEHLDAASKG